MTAFFYILALDIMSLTFCAKHRAFLFPRKVKRKVIMGNLILVTI